VTQRAGVLAVLLLAVALVVLAGCGNRDNTSDGDRQGGFYSGVSGGLSR
jgi:hypothetical protein